jgi:hypothetical protein
MTRGESNLEARYIYLARRPELGETMAVPVFRLYSLVDA